MVHEIGLLDNYLITHLLILFLNRASLPYLILHYHAVQYLILHYHTVTDVGEIRSGTVSSNDERKKKKKSERQKIIIIKIKVKIKIFRHLLSIVPLKKNLALNFFSN
jgi:hypothetical protein